MAKFTLAEIRERMLAEKERSTGNGNRNAPRARSGGDKAMFPFWDGKIGGDPTVLRFLPDADDQNMYWWQNRQVIKLPFNGIVGGDYPTSKLVEVTVPCLAMFKKKDPIIDFCRKFWDFPDGSPEKILAKTYWKKQSYIMQGFVVKTPIIEEDGPENPIRRFTVNPQLFKVIETAILDPENEDVPTDYDNGYDFSIKKTQQGPHANYSTSSYSRKTRSLSADERAAIEQHGLNDLKTYLGSEPDAERIALTTALFHSSMAGDPFDVSSFGDHFRAYPKSRNEGEGDGDTMAAIQALAPRATQHVVSTPSFGRTVPDVSEANLYEPAATAAPAPAAPAAAVRKTPEEIIAEIKARMPS